MPRDRKRILRPGLTLFGESRPQKGLEELRRLCRELNGSEIFIRKRDLAICRDQPRDPR